MADEELLTQGGEAPPTEGPGGDAGGAPEPSLRDTIAQAMADQADAAEAEGKPRPSARPPVIPQKGADGRFLKGGPAPQDRANLVKGKQPPAAEARQQAPQAQQTPAPQEGQKPRPPVGWSPEAKAAFDKLPPAVQTAVVQREQDVAQGLNRLAYFKNVDRFAEAAVQGGTTLENALTAYTTIENMLRQDPAAGMIEILKNIPMHPGVVLQEVLRRLGGQPSPQGQPQAQLPPQLAQQINALTQFANDTIREREMTNRQMADQHVANFWNDPAHPYAENVAPQMVDLINLAKARGEQIDLAKIYEAACYIHPEVRQLLVNQQLSSPSSVSRGRNAVAASARSAGRATTGAPASGGQPGMRAPNPNESLRDTIVAAMEAQRG